MPVYRTGQAIDTSVIVFLGKNSQGIGDRMFAQQPRVITIKRIIRKPLLFQRSTDAGCEIRLIVIPDFTESYKVRFQANNLIDNGVISSRYHRTFLPYIPLQYCKFITLLTSCKDGNK